LIAFLSKDISQVLNHLNILKNHAFSSNIDLQLRIDIPDNFQFQIQEQNYLKVILTVINEDLNHDLDKQTFVRIREPKDVKSNFLTKDFIFKLSKDVPSMTNASFELSIPIQNIEKGTYKT